MTYEIPKGKGLMKDIPKEEKEQILEGIRVLLHGAKTEGVVEEFKEVAPVSGEMKELMKEFLLGNKTPDQVLGDIDKTRKETEQLEKKLISEKRAAFKELQNKWVEKSHEQAEKEEELYQKTEELKIIYEELELLIMEIIPFRKNELKKHKLTESEIEKDSEIIKRREQFKELKKIWEEKEKEWNEINNSLKRIETGFKYLKDDLKRLFNARTKPPKGSN